jgi:uncharacterized protein DUF1629
MSKAYIWQFTERYRVFEGVTEKDDLYLDYDELSKFSGSWEAPTIVNADEKGRKTKLGDFPATTGFCHLVSEAARGKLGGLLEKYGLLLPIKILDDDVNEEFYLYKCTNVVDCLDSEKSNIKYSIFDSNDIATIREPKFIEERIEPKSLFVVPENEGGHIYVTEEFKQEVKELRLKGLVLVSSMLNDDEDWIS